MNLDQQLSLLRRINRTRVSGRPIYDHFLYRDVSLWSFFQDHIWSDIKRGPERLQKARVRQSFFVKRKIFVLRFFSFGLSLVCVLYLLISKRKVLIYTTDAVTPPKGVDHRIGKIYTFLEKHKIPFEELIHAPIHRKFLANFVKRRRPVYYIEAIDFFFGLFARWRKRWYFGKIRIGDVDFGEFSEEEKPFVWNILSGYAQRAEGTRFRVAVLSRLLSLLGVQRILLIDDSRYYGEVVFAAKLAHIQSVAFQHGGFTKYYVGQTLYEIPPEKCIAPDVYCVWNEYWRRKLLTLNTIYGSRPNKVVISGKPTATSTRFDFFESADDKICTILVPYETPAHRDEILAYVKIFLKCPDVAVMFKLRKDRPGKEQLVQFGLHRLAEAHEISVVTDISRPDMGRIDLVVGTCSTLLSEMIEAGKPIGILQSSTSESEELISDGLADPIGGDADMICRQVHRIAATPRDVLDKRAAMLKVEQNIEEFLEQLLITVSDATLRVV